MFKTSVHLSLKETRTHCTALFVIAISVCWKWAIISVWTFWTCVHVSRQSSCVWSANALSWVPTCNNINFTQGWLSGSLSAKYPSPLTRPFLLQWIRNIYAARPRQLVKIKKECTEEGGGGRRVTSEIQSAMNQKYFCLQRQIQKECTNLTGEGDGWPGTGGSTESCCPWAPITLALPHLHCFPSLFVSKFKYKYTNTMTMVRMINRLEWAIITLVAIQRWNLSVPSVPAAV